MTKAIAAMTIVVAVSSCKASLEERFISGRSFDPCGQVIPACPGLFAGCVLDESRFTRITFPGEVRFLVETGEDQLIDVLLFLSEQRDSGVTTRILWHEPGCSDVYQFEGEGPLLLDEAEGGGIIQRTQNVILAGEHLVEVFSDMQADVVISTQVRVDAR